MAIVVPKEAKEEVMKLQQYQEQLQMLNMEKQNISSNILNINHSIEELRKVTKESVYEIVGTVMIKRDKDMLINSLVEKKESLELKDNVLSKQIDRLSAKVNELQKKIMKMVGGNKNG